MVLNNVLMNGDESERFSDIQLEEENSSSSFSSESQKEEPEGDATPRHNETFSQRLAMNALISQTADTRRRDDGGKLSNIYECQSEINT